MKYEVNDEINREVRSANKRAESPHQKFKLIRTEATSTPTSSTKGSLEN